MSKTHDRKSVEFGFNAGINHVISVINNRIEELEGDECLAAMIERQSLFELKKRIKPPQQPD